MNRWAFGLGTLGRDGLAALVSMFLMFYLSDVLDIDAIRRKAAAKEQQRGR